MTFQGSPHTRLRKAIATGNPLLVRAAAAELPHVALEDALAIWSRAARLRARALRAERGPLANLAALRHPRRARLAAFELSELCREASLTRAGVLLETRSQQRGQRDR